MPRWTRLIVPFLIVGTAYYLYHSNYFVDLYAVFELVPTHVSVRATGGDYHDCKVTLTGGFSSPPFDIRWNETKILQIHTFHQWNGTELESVRLLPSQIEIDLRCNEGRVSAKEYNRHTDSE